MHMICIVVMCFNYDMHYSCICKMFEVGHKMSLSLEITVQEVAYKCGSADKSFYCLRSWVCDLIVIYRS